MKILPITTFAPMVKNAQPIKPNTISFSAQPNSSSYAFKTIPGENGQILNYRDEKGLFDVENISDGKVGTKFLLHPKDAKYKDLTILFTPESQVSSVDDSTRFVVTTQMSFGGKVFGSIRKDANGEDKTMMKAYSDFWDTKMHKTILADYVDKEATAGIKDDYNFFIPSDGDGTRYRDIAKLQGGVTKPASKIPAQLNGQDMKLVQVILTNFAKTDKLDDGYDFVKVQPALGSAYAFFEGLANGQIPTDRPLVFSWGDNFSDIDITKLIKEHEANHAGFTMLTLPVDSNRIRSLGAAKVKGQDDLEVSKFYEKPNTDELVKEFIIPGTKDQCLGVVGPYVLSKEVLTWLKDNYVNHPEQFKDQEGKVDFSRTIIGKLIDVMPKGEIKDENGNALKLYAYRKPSSDSWSDLGRQSDFTKEMLNVKHGGFKNLPGEVRESIYENIDDNNNISFNEKTQKLLHDFAHEYRINMKNVIAYAK